MREPRFQYAEGGDYVPLSQAPTEELAYVANGQPISIDPADSDEDVGFLRLYAAILLRERQG